MSLSLINLLKSDSDFQRRLAKRIDEVKEDKGKILSCAENYGNKYKQEVLEGEALRLNLLTEGNRKGMSEEQIFAGRGFIPMKSTPILNMLYFLLSESDTDPYYGKELQRKRDKLNEYLTSTYKTENDILESDEALQDIAELLYERSEERQNINQQLRENTTIEEVGETTEPDMETLIYDNVDLKTFNTIKKLKALASRSSSIDESVAAYRKCLEMCQKYNLSYDKIPCYVKGDI